VAYSHFLSSFFFIVPYPQLVLGQVVHMYSCEQFRKPLQTTHGSVVGCSFFLQVLLLQGCTYPQITVNALPHRNALLLTANTY
jgi:hypothetical protein